MQTTFHIGGLQHRMGAGFVPDPIFITSSWQLWVLIGVILLLTEALLRVGVTFPIGLAALLMIPVLWVIPASGPLVIPVWVALSAVVWAIGRGRLAR